MPGAGEIIPDMPHGTVGGHSPIAGRSASHPDRTRLIELLPRNLMAKDEMKNLGFKEDNSQGEQAASNKAGVKGVLMW